MTTIAKKTDEATLIAQLKQMSHNARIKLEKLARQKADIERKRVELTSELATISPAKEPYHQRLQVAQNECAQLKVQLIRLAQYLELAYGTFEEQAAAEDVARVQKDVDEAEKTRARLQKETDEAERSFTNQEQEIQTALQTLDTQDQALTAEHSSITAIRQQKHDELCEALFTQMTGPYLKNQERLEALQRELVAIQAQCRAECVSKLAGWTHLRQRLSEVILPDSPTYRVLSAELAYLEAIVAEKEHLNEPVNLPAARTLAPGPKTKADLLSLPEQEVHEATSMLRRTDKIEVRIHLLKHIISELDRF